MVHKPFMSETEAKRRIDWQNKAYREHLKSNKRFTIEFYRKKIVVMPNVFAPVPWDDNLLAKTVLKETKESDKVLDMGTGTGVQAILAGLKSADVTAVDVNPFAVKCAKQNVNLNNLSSRVKVIKSDLFDNVKGTFDIIIFDPPFRWSKPRDIWEKSCTDEDYATMKKFFQQVSNYLNQRGRILIHFGTSGDISYLKHLIKKNGFRRKQILKKDKAGWTYFSYRLTC